MVAGATTAPTVAVVQAAVQAQWASAQAALTANASPLAGVAGTQYTGSSWTSVASGLVVFDPLGRLTTSVDWAASAGLVPGMTVGRATGYCATSAASNAPILNTAYTPQGTNGQRSFASSSANDSSAGTGARQITVTYLDASFAVHQEVVTLNGITPVNTVGVNIAFYESFQVTQVGSGGVNAGTISSYTAVGGGGTVWATLPVDGSNQTNWCHHYVPAGVTCYVRSLSGASFSVAGTVFLMHTGNPLTSNLPLTQFGPTVMHPGGDSREHAFSASPAIVGPDRIVLYVRPQAATADSTLGNFEWVQF